MVIEHKTPEKKPKPDDWIACETCLTYGILQRNPDFKEPYGYPYRPATVTCGDCLGLGWIPTYANEIDFSKPDYVSPDVREVPKNDSQSK